MVMVMERRIKAIFKGKDLSLGYRADKEYELLFSCSHLYPVLLPNGKKYPIAIKRLDGTGLCPYASFHAFYANWDKVREVKQ